MQIPAATFQVFMNHQRIFSIRMLQAVLLLGIFVSVLFWTFLHWGQVAALIWMITGGLVFSWFWRRSGYISAELIVNEVGIQWVLKHRRAVQHSDIIPWAQLSGFQFAFQGLGPNLLILKWIDGQKIKFYSGEVRKAFDYLVRHFPEKEKAFWYPPSQP